MTNYADINESSEADSRSLSNVRARKKTSRDGCCNFFSRVDLLGSPINLNMNGRGSYQTPFGACLSIFVVMVVVSYSLIKLIRMVTHEEPDFVKNEVLKDMYNEYPEPFAANNNYFELAVGFLSISPYLFVPHDETYGNWNFRQVTMD